MSFKVFGTQPQATVPDLLEAIANLGHGPHGAGMLWRRPHKSIWRCHDAGTWTESPAALGQQHRPHIAMITPAEDIKSLFVALKILQTTWTSPALHWLSYYFIRPMFWPTSWQCRRWSTNSRGTWLESFPQSPALETSASLLTFWTFGDHTISYGKLVNLSNSVQQCPCFQNHGWHSPQFEAPTQPPLKDHLHNNRLATAVSQNLGAETSQVTRVKLNLWKTLQLLYWKRWVAMGVLGQSWSVWKTSDVLGLNKMHLIESVLSNLRTSTF